MRAALVLVLLSVAGSGPALAQPVGPIPVSRFDTAPWWMAQPIIASTGYVRTELPANRASFTASFQSIERTSADATRAAADKVRALGQTLRAFGADKVRIETTFTTQPLFEQYRDKEGNLINNQRADKIERYQVSANVSVEIRSVVLVERAYAAVVAAGPSSTGPVEFELKADNETNTQLFRSAVVDASQRARLAAEATGAHLGPVRLIDPTGRACQTDVLVAGATPEAALTVTPTEVPPVPLAAPAPAMASSAAQSVGQVTETPLLPLQPPLRELTNSACVTYALNP